jgi:hypothetical protein
MAKRKGSEDEKRPAAGKGGSPASSTPNEEARASNDGDGKSANSGTPKESKESAGGKGGGQH